MGLFPVKILEATLADTAWLGNKPTPRGIFEQVMQELLGFLASLED
jgi:hypothetical protein